MAPTAYSISIDPPAGPIAFEGTGLAASVWAFDTPITNIADAEARIVGDPPDTTFRALAINFPLSFGENLQGFVGSDGTDFAGATLNTVRMTYFVFTGYIALPVNSANSIPFELVSDDGSRLLLGGVNVIDNDGTHMSVSETGSAELAQTGLYSIQIKYFNDGGGGELRLNYDPENSGTFVLVPTTALYTDLSTAVPEPGTSALGGAALLVIAALRRRRHLARRTEYR